MQWNHNTIYTNLSDENSKVRLIDEDRLAIQVSIECQSSFFDGDDIRDIFNITFYHVSRYFDDKNFSHYNTTPLKFDRCSKYDFKGYKTLPQRDTSSEYQYWFNLTGVEISGNLGNYDTFENLAIGIDSEVNGLTTNLYSNLARTLKISIATEQQYVDLDDLDRVIKPLYTEIDQVSFSQEVTQK